MITESGAGTLGAATLVAGLTAATSFTPFGVRLDTLVLGGVCFFGGAAARTGLKLYKTLDTTNEPVNAGRAIAALLCTVPISGAASCIAFLAAHVTGVNADAAIGGGLLILGIRGAEGFQWLVDQVSNVFTRLMPGQGKATPTPDPKAPGAGP